MDGVGDIDAFFAEYESGRPLFEAVWRIVDGFEGVERRVSKSQIAFRHRVGFAWVWVPGRYLMGAVSPLVISVALRRRDHSSRWKEVVEPKPGYYMHHLEVRSIEEIDGQVAGWLQEAWSAAS